MLQTEMKLMLEKLIKDKKSFKELYKTGSFSYSKDKPFKGEVVVVGDRALIAYLQDLNDENRAIATADFQENGTLIFKLLGDNWSQHQFDWEDKDTYTYGGNYSAIVHNYDRDKVAREIETIRKHCAETPKKESILQSLGKKKLTKKQVYSLLLETLDKLNRTKELSEKKEVCPKVEVGTLDTTEIPHQSVPEVDKSPEIFE